MFLGIANASATAAGPAAVAAEPAVPTSAVPPQGMRKNGKQWRPVKKAFRPKAGSTSYERRKANDEAMAATKAKEKEMKEEKEAARQAHVTKIKEKRASKEERERYEKMAQTMHQKRVDRLRRREKRNKMLKS